MKKYINISDTQIFEFKSMYVRSFNDLYRVVFNNDEKSYVEYQSLEDIINMVNKFKMFLDTDTTIFTIKNI